MSKIKMPLPLFRDKSMTPAVPPGLAKNARLFHIRMICASLVTGEVPGKYYSLPFGLPS